MGLAGQMVHSIAECGPSFRRRLAAGGLLPALCSAASADLATGAASGARLPVGRFCSCLSHFVAVTRASCNVAHRPCNAVSALQWRSEHEASSVGSDSAAARRQRRPSSDADLPQLWHVASGVATLADAAVAEGRAATATLLDTGVPELLIQVPIKLCTR